MKKVYDEALMAVLDQADELADKIKASEAFDAYQKAKSSLESDQVAQSLYDDFLKSKVKYDEVQRFGRYHPDYQEVMRQTRRLKKAYEMHKSVVNFKRFETELQQLLDEVVTIIGTSVSENVKIDAGTPLFEALTTGGCATGASCQCHPQL
ncbi:YlbF family regulator [Staphylococcus schleiferi subsp. schleiferi]|uniref:ComK regulator n=1 Tax=Staphylococcus schleiferi TaxID=1295 RepID=A0A7Z7QQB9_STASC|nr:YlbF family regulator [Staphylococcus schleiferi subsp. schleiferi]CAD7360139.1 ComK regulator [Staphylococcus schleiferi]SUM89509.1 ComK regulator [Staphylococcus schleiferi]